MRIGAVVIGTGEIGLPLFMILKRTYPDTVAYDIKEGKDFNIKCEYLNICFPYSDGFIEEVKRYQVIAEPNLTIIHSTVPIGTTGLIQNAVHSPVLGDHKNMLESLKRFPKWIGGAKATDAEVFMSLAGIMCRIVPTSHETELLKLMCLAKYGMSIAFAQCQKEWCNYFKIDYAHVLEWDMNYNLHVHSSKQRPIISPPGKKIGGHCVISGTKMLNDFESNPILQEILSYE